MTEQIPGDVCDTCSSPYTISAANAKLFCFLEYPRANHVEVVCPNGHTENIFLASDGFMHVLNLCKTGVVFALLPSDEFKAECDSALGLDELVYTNESAPVERVVEADPPHWMLRELYDDLRNYENTN